MSTSWFDLTGKVALVTGGGANGGNGHAVALALAEHGADVFISDVDSDGLDKSVREITALGRRVGSMRCDNGHPGDIAAMFDAFDHNFDRLDVLVNNVGIGHRSRPEDISLADWQRVIRVNLDGTFLCTQETGRRMIARGGGGSIINVSSIAGSSALGRGNFVYSVTKSGINQFTKELAIEWAPHKIRVNAIQPAQVLTPALQRVFDDLRDGQNVLRARLLSGIPLDRFAVPEDVAKAALFLASDASAFITGHLLPVDGGNLVLNGGGSKVWPKD